MGTNLAPDSGIHIKCNTSRSGLHTQIIGYTIDAEGDSNVCVRCIDAHNDDALHYPKVQFAQ